MQNKENIATIEVKSNQMPVDSPSEEIPCGDLDYKFSDLFDLAEIQRIQDAFSAATGVASLILEVDGTPITKPSNFCSFCDEIVRETEKGQKNCKLSDSVIGSPKKDGPRIQRCLSGGLLDSGASIMVGDKHIASWLVGQVLDTDYNYEDMLSYADEIGVDRNVFSEALSKVTRMPKQQFTDISNFLYLTVQQLSKLAITNITQTQEIVKRKKAELEINTMNNELEKIVYARTSQLEETNSEMEEINATLEEEIVERQKAEEEIKNMNSQLDQKIVERTFLLKKTNVELEETNSMLEEEIEERIKIEEALKESERRLIAAQSMAHVGNWELNLDTKTIWASEEVFNIYGIEYIKQDLLLELIQKNVFPEYRKALDNALINLITKNEKYDEEFKIKNAKTGEEHFVHSKAILLFDETGNKATKVIGTLQDITERKEKEKEIIYLSYHDKLTGLYNRRFYEEEIKRLDTERNLPISIIIGDVNGLKLVNDAFGHDKGDELLQKAATSIQSACRTDDIVARWGGDEFVILLPKTKPEEVKSIIYRIKELYSNQQVNALSVSISLGWDTKRKTDEDILKVLKSAEDFMYKHKILENEGMRGNTISTIINTLHEKNPREEQHSKRVSEICQNIGIAIGFSEIKISKLKVVGLLHDIGKIAIEEGILNKPGKLTEHERDEIKRHPDIGYRILSSSYDMLELANCILAHHERWDGAGYPKGLKGEAIPMVARIIALADSYDAMTSERTYRKALSEEEALLEIRKNAGTQFDPEIARIFIEKVLDKRWD